MVGIRDGDRCCISEKRLGERLHRSERTAHAYIHELIRAGYIEPIDPENGSRRTYRIVALTPEAHFSGSDRPPEGRPLKKLTGTPANRFSGTYANGFSHPRSIDLSLEKNNSEKKKNERSLRDNLLLELKRCNLKGTTPEKEGDRLIRRFPGLVNRLSCHLRCALDANIENPIKYADYQTGRGENPKLITENTALSAPSEAMRPSAD